MPLSGYMPRWERMGWVWDPWVLCKPTSVCSEFWREKARWEEDSRYERQAGQHFRSDQRKPSQHLGYLRELQWRISEGDVFLIQRESDTDLNRVITRFMVGHNTTHV